MTLKAEPVRKFGHRLTPFSRPSSSSRAWPPLKSWPDAQRGAYQPRSRGSKIDSNTSAQFGEERQHSWRPDFVTYGLNHAHSSIPQA